MLPSHLSLGLPSGLLLSGLHYIIIIIIIIIIIVVVVVVVVPGLAERFTSRHGHRIE
jgi:hypothetical protein